MDKKKKILIGFGGCVGLYALAYLIGLLVVKIAEGKAYGKGGESNEGNAGKYSGSGWNDFPLKWGSGTYRNQNIARSKWAVKQIQIVCNGWVKNGLQVDGVWGDKTESAVQALKSIQTRRKDVPAGTYGGYEMSAYGSGTIKPFENYITPVQNPASPLSRVQITNNAALKNIINWHNDNVKKYVKVV